MARKDKVKRSKKKGPAKLYAGRRRALWPSTDGRANWRFVAAGESHAGAVVVADETAEGWKLRKLPEGALIADPKKQMYEGGYWAFLAYIDLPYTCRGCGADAVFTARAQRFWYETLKKSPDSMAGGCLDCRRKERRKRRANKALSELLPVYEADPTPQNALAIATVTAELLDSVGERARQRAVGMARKAERAGLNADAVLRQLQR